jgi:O-6-methylguanine DNA methyltransferase
LGECAANKLYPFYGLTGEIQVLKRFSLIFGMIVDYFRHAVIIIEYHVELWAASRSPLPSLDSKIIRMNKKTTIYIGQIKNTPLCRVWAAVSDAGLWAVEYQVPREEFIESVQGRGSVALAESATLTAPVLQEVAEYLQGTRTRFTIPIDWAGMSAFQVEVHQVVMKIPYGQTATYSEIAASIGRPGAARAVGRVNATNPIPLVIPCHRLVGADGSLKGYGGKGGIKTKKWLLDFERSNLPDAQ